MTAVYSYAIYSRVIKSFACPETERIFRGEFSRRLAHDMQKTAVRKLEQLHAAEKLQDLNVFPGNQLEALKGGRTGQHSIRINQQWRICFRWTEDGAEDIEIVDYHR